MNTDERKKVLVTLMFTPDKIADFDKHVRMLEDHGFEVIVDPSYKKVPDDQLIGKLEGIYAHAVGAESVPKEIFDACPDLKIVVRMGAGYDSVDVAAATDHKVAVCNTPGANSHAVADMTAALILNLGRRIQLMNSQVHTGNYDFVFGQQLEGKTLGIIGLGAIGKTLVKYLSGFGIRVLAYDVFRDEAFASANGVEYCDLEKLLKESDYISLHCLLVPETYHLLSDREFAMMKNGVYLINCARGAVIDQDALVRALESGKVAGAALDTLEHEPLTMDNPLLAFENVILTPHSGGMTRETRGNIVEMTFQNIIDYAEGRKPRGLVNPEVMH